jgi:hypothetical protein
MCMGAGGEGSGKRMASLITTYPRLINESEKEAGGPFLKNPAAGGGSTAAELPLSPAPSTFPALRLPTRVIVQTERRTDGMGTVSSLNSRRF